MDAIINLKHEPRLGFMRMLPRAGALRAMPPQNPTSRVWIHPRSALDVVLECEPGSGDPGQAHPSFAGFGGQHARILQSSFGADALKTARYFPVLFALGKLLHVAAVSRPISPMTISI